MISFDRSDYLQNCGDGLIGTITSFIETGRLEPMSEVSVQVPAGVVDARVELDDSDHVERVGIQGMEAFLYGNESVTVELDDEPRDLPVTIGYGGNWFAFVDADAVGITVDQDEINLDKTVADGLAIRAAVNEQIDVRNPLTGEDEYVGIVMFYDERENEVDRNTVIYAAGAIDRSPCGTGTTAKMAWLYDQGRLSVDEEYPHESLIGTRYVGRILDASERDGTTVVNCELSGSGHIIGKHTYLRDPTDDVEPFAL